MCEDIGQYAVDIESKGNYTLPKQPPINNADLYRIIKALAPGLSQCARAVHIDSEASRYPFLYEMLKTLVRLTGTSTVSAHNKNVSTPVEEDEDVIAAIAERFERDSLTDRESAFKEESTVQMLMRWERYFKEKGGYKSAGFGYVEFSVEDKNQLVRCLLECKDFLKRSSGPVTASGFWQACGEAVTAQQCNIANAATKAGEIAYAAALASYPLQETTARLSKSATSLKAAKYSQAKQQAAASAKEAAEKEAAEQQLGVPIFVVLTDVREWIFIKLEGKVITYSAPVSMFDVNQGEIQALPGLIVGLQYLCQAVGINSNSSDITAKLESAVECTTADSLALVESVFPSVGPLLENACGFLKGTIGLLSAEAHRAAFEKEYPSLNYDQCVSSLHEKA